MVLTFTSRFIEGTEKRRLNGEDHSLKNILLRLFLRFSVSLWDPVPSVTSVPVRGTRGTHGSSRRSHEEKTEKFFSVLFSVPPFLCVIPFPPYPPLPFPPYPPFPFPP
jgi:hypothetical protein